MTEGEGTISGKFDRHDTGSFESGVFSIPSKNHQDDHNEDRAFASDTDGLYAVFDGLGGGAGGEVAAQTAAEYLQSFGAEMLSKAKTPKEMDQQISIVIAQINQRIQEKALENPALSGLGATCSMLKFWQDTDGINRAIIANVGDSRVYRRRAGSADLEQLSVDHLDYEAAQKMSNLTSAERSNIEEALNNATSLKDLARLTPAELDVFTFIFKSRHLTGTALGFPSADFHVDAIIEVDKGDEFLITSDGIHDNSTQTTLGKRLLEQAGLSAAESAQNIVQKSLSDSHTRPGNSLPNNLPAETKAALGDLKNFTRQKPDDLTAVVVRAP